MLMLKHCSQTKMTIASPLARSPSRNCKMMEALLAKMHRAMAIQVQLANTGAILSLNQGQLTQELTFTRCTDAVLGPLRQEGLRILNYLDDWLVQKQKNRFVTM